MLQVVTCSRKSTNGSTGIDLMTLTPDAPDAATVKYWTDTMSYQVNQRETDLRSPLEPATARSASTTAPARKMNETQLQKTVRRAKRQIARIFN